MGGEQKLSRGAGLPSQLCA